MAQASAGRTVATRTELKSSVVAYKLRSSVNSIDTVNKTFFVGGAKVFYANVIATGLAQNASVNLRLATTQQAGAWEAPALVVETSRTLDDCSEADIHGIVTAITTPSQLMGPRRSWL